MFEGSLPVGDMLMTEPDVFELALVLAFHAGDECKGIEVM